MIHRLLPEDWQPSPQLSLRMGAFCVLAGVIGFSSHCVYGLDVPWRLKQLSSPRAAAIETGSRRRALGVRGDGACRGRTVDLAKQEGSEPSISKTRPGVSGWSRRRRPFAHVTVSRSLNSTRSKEASRRGPPLRDRLRSARAPGRTNGRTPVRQRLVSPIAGCCSAKRQLWTVTRQHLHRRKRREHNVICACAWRSGTSASSPLRTWPPRVAGAGAWPWLYGSCTRCDRCAG